MRRGHCSNARLLLDPLLEALWRRLLRSESCLVSVRATSVERPPSNLEVETSLLELLVLFLVEAVEPGGPVGHVFLDLVERHEKVHAQDLLAEVALVEPLLQDRFVEPLQLR